jgi:hypothetical protein
LLPHRGERGIHDELSFAGRIERYRMGGALRVARNALISESKELSRNIRNIKD